MGSPKVICGQPNSLILLYKYRGLRVKEDPIFPVRQVKRYCKKNYFFAIKNYCFPVGEILVVRSNIMLWAGER